MVTARLDTHHPYRVWHPWTSMPDLTRESRLHLNIERASGSYLYARDGFRFMDGSAGLWNVLLGHGREDVIRAISEQLHRLTYLCNIEARSQIANDFADLLLTHAPRHIGRVMLHCTGTAAVEGAVLLVRQYFKMVDQPQRVGVISVERAYHGCSLLGASVSGYHEDARWFEPLPPGFYKIPAPENDEAARHSLDVLRHLLTNPGAETLAAFVFEPIMGVGGIIVPPPWWTSEVISLCRQSGLKVIADEVTTALGRVGAWFACADEAVDIIALGKGVSGGYIPLAATLYAEELFEPFHRGVQPVDFKYGSTMDGYPAACAAGIAVLRALEHEGLVSRAATLGARLLEQCKELEQLEVVGPVRGRGLMLGIPLIEPRTDGKPMSDEKIFQVHTRLMAAGLLMHPVETSTLAVLPPLTITKQESAELVATLGDVLTSFNRRYTRRK